MARDTSSATRGRLRAPYHGATWLSRQDRANARTAPCMLLKDHPALRDLRHPSTSPEASHDMNEGIETPGSSEIEGSLELAGGAAARTEQLSRGHRQLRSSPNLVQPEVATGLRRTSSVQ